MAREWAEQPSTVSLLDLSPSGRYVTNFTKSMDGVLAARFS